MSKIQLYLLDDDTSYADRLTSFIRTSEFADRLQVKLFTKVEFLGDLLDRTPSEGVLLFSEAYAPQIMDGYTSLCKMILTQSISIPLDEQTETPFLYRFQPLRQLLSQVTAYYWEKQKAIVAHGIKSTQVLSVYSSVGNSGKSITAVHLAKQLSLRGKRVFYLSLESISTASLWLKGDSSRFSQILYYLKSAYELLGPKLELLKAYDSHLRIDYMAPHDQIREMQEMTGEDVRLLLETIKALKQYDYIIIDLEASMHPRIVKALGLSDHILWILQDDLFDLFKTGILLRKLGAVHTMHIIVNKYMGKQINDFSMLSSFSVKAYLPYIPEWKIIHDPEQIWQSNLFSQQVFHMFVACVPSAFILNGEGEAAAS